VDHSTPQSQRPASCKTLAFFFRPWFLGDKSGLLDGVSSFSRLRKVLDCRHLTLHGGIPLRPQLRGSRCQYLGNATLDTL
jgi:hypothetical protein